MASLDRWFGGGNGRCAGAITHSHTH